MQLKYRSIVKFSYKGLQYHLFYDQYSRMAFLKINENGSYTYPSMSELVELTHIFVSDKNYNFMKKRKAQFFRFTPKVKIAGVLVALSIPFLSACVTQNFYNHKSTTSTTYATSSQARDEFAYNGTGVPDSLSDEILAGYLEYLAPADDEFDYKYRSDYQFYELVKIEKTLDSSSYEQVFGHQNVSLDQIKMALDENPNISETYKDFIYQYAKDLRNLYPNINLTVLHKNLSTLQIEELTENQMMDETLSMDSVACYLKQENRICVLPNLDLNKDSDDYIIFVHELSHAARTTQFENSDGVKVYAKFFDYYKMGTYAEEAIITNLAYELQGLGKRAEYYPFQSSLYRIITDCINYTPEDFFDHGVTYLIEKMDNFMGDDQYAFQIVAMIDAQASLRYTPYADVDYHEFLPLYEYVAEMYFKKYITADMLYEDAVSVFEEFYTNITHQFDDMNRKYDIDESTFLPTFEEYISELGINAETNVHSRLV